LLTRNLQKEFYPEGMPTSDLSWNLMRIPCFLYLLFSLHCALTTPWSTVTLRP